MDARLIVSSIVFAVSSYVTAAPRVIPIVDKEVIFETESPRTVEQVRGYLLAGAERCKGWLSHSIDADAPGALQVTFNRADKHFFTLALNHDGSGYQLKYQDSRNLNFRESNGERYIHSNYARWIGCLTTQIELAHAMHLDARGQPTDINKLARLEFRAEGFSDPVTFAKADEGKTCEKYERIGTIANNTEAAILAREEEIRAWENRHGGKVVMFGQRLGPPRLPATTMLIYLPPMRPVQIQGYSSAQVPTGMVNSWGQGIMTSRSCGPIYQRFTPEAGKAYRVEFAQAFQMMRDGQCTLRLLDITDTESPKPVSTTALDVCPKEAGSREVNWALD